MTIIPNASLNTKQKYRERHNFQMYGHANFKVKYKQELMKKAKMIL